MNEIDNTAERVQELMYDMIMVMNKYKDEQSKVVGNIQKELDKSLGEQRKMMVDMVRGDLLEKASEQVQGYAQDMDEVRSQMVEQVREFNTYLRTVNSENQKIFRTTVLGTAITLAVLLIGGVALTFFYSGIISQKKVDADMLSRINNADIVRCGDGLCAKTGKVGNNGYRTIQQRHSVQ